MYVDWAMCSAAIVALCAALIFVVLAVTPIAKGRRRQFIRRSLISLLVFAMYSATNWALFDALSDVHSTSLSDILSAFPVNLIFSLPLVGMAAGLIWSVVYAIRSILYQTGPDRRRSLLKASLAGAIFCLGAAPHTAAILMRYLIDESHHNKEGTLVRAGDVVPDFDLATLEGTQFNTAALRGRVVVINLFATWCGPCNQELPHLEALWQEFHENADFRMLVIDREETVETLKAFREKHSFTFPMAADPRATACSRFATSYIPRTFLISREGKILYEWTGNYETEISKLRRLLKKELAKRT
jgi:peroxiredoxin